MEQYRKDFYKDIFKLFCIFANFPLFFLYTVNTQVTFLNLVISFIVYVIVGMIFFNVFKFEKLFHKSIYIVIILPLLFNIFFLINYKFSSNNTIEKYRYSRGSVIVGNRWERGKVGTSTTITLPSNKYEEYYFFRTFLDYTKIDRNVYILYTFADGFFGFRVMKDYKFSRY